MPHMPPPPPMAAFCVFFCWPSFAGYLSRRRPPRRKETAFGACRKEASRKTGIASFEFCLSTRSSTRHGPGENG
ncbi:hypothetical protein V8C43DRAFT_275014 [Trichoderma afarasin]